MVDVVSQDGPFASARPRVMIVDDEPIVVKVLGLHLKRAGYTDLASTTESRTALEKIRECRPDVLLLDIHMPHLSGFDILGQIQADAQLANLPVVIITASCDAETKARAGELGARGMLSKPVDPADLISCVRQLTKST